MTHRTFSLVTAIIFSLVALLMPSASFVGGRSLSRGSHANLDQLDRARHRGVLGLPRFSIEEDAHE